MSFDANKVKLVSGSKLKANDLYIGIVINVEDGKVRDFIPETAYAGWKGDIDSPALNVTVEVKEGEEIVRVHKMFTYIEDNGEIVVSDKSNLGKYHNLYKKYPQAGDQVKVTTNGDGFGSIKIE